jgi:CheY-like chemotaxis protein
MNTNATNHPNSPAVLLVEDNEDDVFLMRRALRDSGVSISLHVVEDGQQAIDYLAGEGRYVDRSLAPSPALVFLDLKLPYLDGFEVLSWIRAVERLRRLPVVVLTSSPEERDRRRAAELGADQYCVKPPSRDMLKSVLRHLCPTLTPMH